MSNFDVEKSEIASLVADSAYKRGNIGKARTLERVYGERFQILPDHTSKEYVTYLDKSDGKIWFGLRGTDIENKQGGKAKDLETDVLVALGYHTLSNRYKRSDKKLQQLIDEYGKDDIILAGHSLGGSIGMELGHKHGVEAHLFNQGGSHVTYGSAFRGLHPTTRKNKKKIHSYYVGTATPDVLSFTTQLPASILSQVHFVEPKKLKKKDRGIIDAHSIKHFYPPEGETRF